MPRAPLLNIDTDGAQEVLGQQYESLLPQSWDPKDSESETLPNPRLVRHVNRPPTYRSAPVDPTSVFLYVRHHYATVRELFRHVTFFFLCMSQGISSLF